MVRHIAARFAFAGLLVLPLAPVAHADAPAGQAQAEIRAALIRWRDAFNARDARGICALFAPDLIASNQGGPDSGHDAVCARLRRALNDPRMAYRYAVRIEEIIVSGSLAVVRLVWTLDARRRDGAGESVSEEVDMDVFRRQGDGSWKIVRFVSYPAAP